MKQVFIDLEWSVHPLPQKTFLLSWYKNKKENGSLYGRALTGANIQKILKGVDYIFVYGPDIGRMENEFDLKLKENFKCINVLTAFKRLKPRLKNHKLENVERHYKIHRKTAEIKSQRNNLFFIWKKQPERVKEYCAEDSFNLMLVYYKLLKEKKMTRKDFLKFRLMPK